MKTLDKPGVVAALKNFHARYYSSNLMKLVVLGKESLDELQVRSAVNVVCVFVCFLSDTAAVPNKPPYFCSLASAACLCRPPLFPCSKPFRTLKRSHPPSYKTHSPSPSTPSALT